MLYDLMTLPDEPREEDLLLARLADIERRLGELEARPIVVAAPAPVVLEETVGEDVQDEDAYDAASAYDKLLREFAEIEALHDAKQALLDEVLKICKPSVSKLANQIRALLEPQPTVDPEPEPVELVHAAPTGGKSPCGVHYLKGTFGTDPTCPTCLAAEGPASVEPIYAAGPPAHDAPVEEWRAHARALGYNGPDVDKANRSQIRTMLGIEQPVES